MKLYLDTEFTSFGGELMSIALVPADTSKPSFYRVVEYNESKVDPWVKINVVPHLGEEPVSREACARALAIYLRFFDEKVTVIADWPSDLSHLLDVFIIGPGQMVRAPDFDMSYRSLRGFNTADHSTVPHNALADAVALRNHCEDAGE